MHDIVSYGEVGIAFDAFPVGREFFGAVLPGFPAKQLRVSQYGKLQAGVFHAGRKRTDPDAAVAGFRQRFHLWPDQHWDIVLLQVSLQNLCAALVAGQDHNPVALLPVDLHVISGRLCISGIGRQLFCLDAEQGFRLKSSAAQCERVRRIDRKALQFFPDLFRRKAERICFEEAKSVFLQHAKIFSQLLSVFSCHFAAAGRLVHKHKCIGGNIVKPCCRRIQQRQPAIQIRYPQTRPDFLRICLG